MTYQRKNYLGGSDIAAILGISFKKTALDVYLDKVCPSEKKRGTKETDRGNRAEAYVLDTYTDETKNDLTRGIKTFFDQQYPFLAGNIDAKVKNKNIIVEAKTTAESLSQWDDGIPEYYKTQVGHYAWLLDAERVDIPVVFSAWKYKCFTYERDTEYEKNLKERAIQFWTNHVLKKIPPDPICLEDVIKLYPVSNGKKIKLLGSLKKTFENLKSLKADIKEKQEAFKQGVKIIQEYMEKNEVLCDNEKDLVTWKTQTSKRFDTRAFAEDYPGLSDQYKKGITIRVFKIK
ncbi:MAG: hypothetical protein GY858_09880 [Candidatus Omnitrophica bacterium]|nr:hypothetical protein [Candidatus Omnitrophota bacterium]